MPQPNGQPHPGIALPQGVAEEKRLQQIQQEMLVGYHRHLMLEIGGRVAAADILHQIKIQSPDLGRPMDLDNAERIVDAVEWYSRILTQRAFNLK